MAVMVVQGSHYEDLHKVTQGPIGEELLGKLAGLFSSAPRTYGIAQSAS